MEDRAFLLAVVSLFVAGISLFWNVVNATRVDRARLRADLGLNVRLMGGPGGGVAYDLITVAATNVGKRAVTLNSLYLAYGRVWRPWARLLPNVLQDRWFSIYIQLPGDDPFLNAISASPPCRLDVGETQTVYYDRGTVLERAHGAGHSKAFARAIGSTARASSRRVRLPES